MTKKEVRDIIKELISESQEGEQISYGVEYNQRIEYKVLAKNPRHAQEKIEAIYGKNIDLSRIKRLSTGESRSADFFSNTGKKRVRDVKFFQDEEVNEYVRSYFLVPFYSALSKKIQMDLVDAIKNKYIKVSFITTEEEIKRIVNRQSSREPVKPLKVIVYLPKRLLKPTYQKISLNQLKKLVKYDLRYFPHKYNYDLNVTIDDLNRDLVINWVSSLGEPRTAGNINVFEAFDEESDPENVNPFDSEIDNDKGLSAFDIRPGSDLSPGDKVSGTVMPHGYGFPSWSPRGKNRMTRKDLNDILYIKTIEGVNEDDEYRNSKIDQKTTYDFIQKHFPYIFNYGQVSERWPREMWYPFADYFGNEGTFLDWRRDFAAQVNRQLESFIHWKNFNTKDLKNAAKYNRCWILRYKQAIDDSKKYPTLERDLRSLLVFLTKLYDHSPSNSKNPSNYPAFVSLYDTTRRLGGSEEGGWWYDRDDLIHSIPVKNYQEVRKASVVLLRLMGEADLNGKPLIILERESGGRGNKPEPTYS